MTMNKRIEGRGIAGKYNVFVYNKEKQETFLTTKGGWDCVGSYDTFKEALHRWVEVKPTCEFTHYIEYNDSGIFNGVGEDFDEINIEEYMKERGLV